jgi:glycosyltransferase involved in cell wall biosynthesis
MERSGLSVIILTYNEERHIERCITSVAGVADGIFVVDSDSTDRTREIAESLGARVYRNPWVNHATQFNWALANLPVRTTWVLRLDADELIDGELANSLKRLSDFDDSDIAGMYVRLKRVFLGRWIKHGGMYPLFLLRVFRFGAASCELRWMDECIKTTTGRTITLEGNLVDDNQNYLGWWTAKHNGYAIREIVELLNLKYGFFATEMIAPTRTGDPQQRKRWLKHTYASLPLFVRPFIYFLYRYFLKLGFLDGKEGLIWHFLQGFWYRFLVDAMIYEIYRKGGVDTESIKLAIEREYGIKLPALCHG